MSRRSVIYRSCSAAAVFAMAAALCGCQTTGNIDLPLSASGAGVRELHGEALPIPYRAVDLLPEPPDTEYRELGYVLVFVEKPIKGLTVNVSSPARWCRPPAALLVRESGAVVQTTVLVNRTSAAGEELQEALQSRAAQRSANAVIIRASGVDQSGRLWASGMAITR